MDFPTDPEPVDTPTPSSSKASGYPCIFSYVRGTFKSLGYIYSENVYIYICSIIYI